MCHPRSEEWCFFLVGSPASVILVFHILWACTCHKKHPSDICLNYKCQETSFLATFRCPWHDRWSLSMAFFTSLVCFSPHIPNSHGRFVFPLSNGRGVVLNKGSPLSCPRVPSTSILKPRVFATWSCGFWALLSHMSVLHCLVLWASCVQHLKNSFSSAWSCAGPCSFPSRTVLIDTEVDSLCVVNKALPVVWCALSRRGNPLSRMRCQQMNHAAKFKIQHHFQLY